jgi:hypothetical protein
MVLQQHPPILTTSPYRERVELSSNLDGSIDPLEIALASFESYGAAALYRFSSTNETETFFLSQQEIEHLIKAYQAYRAQVQAQAHASPGDDETFS